ncbi:MAG: transcriptional repressor NrdR [Bordetella sp.]|nr:MAG: transcriptional repressor NrdR [Bordetella sp.]
MKCPFCGHSDTQVLDSRVSSEEADTVRRRRRCLSCDKRFTTYERVGLALPSVVKRNGNCSDYDGIKLRNSFALALRKRPIDLKEIDSAVVRIEEFLLISGLREVQTQHIGKLVMNELKKLDQVAYLRYASVYKNFETVKDFINIIEEIHNDSFKIEN